MLLTMLLKLQLTKSDSLMMQYVNKEEKADLSWPSKSRTSYN